MQLHQFSPTKTKKVKKRIGRGGKRGTYSGRGIKGQKSRAGRRIRPAIREFILRLPKRRGFGNKPVRPKPFVFNLGELNRKLKRGFGENKKEQVIDRKLLKSIGFLPLDFQRELKILSEGEIDFPIIIKEKEIKVSAKARQKIREAGGRLTA